MMLAMCLATVAGLMTSSAPMPLLLRPSATILAICSSLGVSGLGGEAGAAAVAASGAARDSVGVADAVGGSSAAAIAAEGDSSRPRAHNSATAASPRRRAGAR